MANLSARVLELAIKIQQIPAPTFNEGPRSEFVRDLFAMESLKDISIDMVGNVYACLSGKNNAVRPLVISAHVDTVFPSSINLQVKEDMGKIIAPGIGDNSLGVAALFGILWALQDQKIELDHDIWLVANVGEEGLGDLRGMRGVVERFDKNVIGYLILEGLALGHVYHRAIGVKRYRIYTRTAGGHSWSDYGQPSAVHELALLVTQLTSIQLPNEPRTTMNVGTINGGTGINVLASEATCELDLRSEDPMVLTKIAVQVEECLHNANRDGVQVHMEVIGQRPAGEIPKDHPIVQLAVNCTRETGIEPVLTSGSTDANIPLSCGIPAVVMGITTGGGAHTTHEYINIESIAMGMDSIVKFVKGVGQ
jgi:acetylornithine deacetylase/succinyl-diaminopimelate desuccinylase-like protein